VDLVDHEQLAQQACTAKVRVRDAENPEERLIDGAHCDRSGEEALGILGGPPAEADARGGIVIPQDVESRETLSFDVVYPKITGHRQNHLGRDRTKHARDVIPNPTVDLDRGRSGR